MRGVREDRERRQGSRGGFTLLVTGAILILACWSAWAAEDWNDAQVAWQSYEKGLAAAKAQKMPVCLIFYTEWCGHCKNYRSVFQDPKVVEQSKRFVMIRLDKDKNKDLSKQYSPDGEYIPRTYFLSSEGKLDPDIHAPRQQYKYFYDEAAPASILSGMDEALRKLR